MKRLSRKISGAVAGVVAAASIAGAQGIFEGGFFDEGIFIGAGAGYVSTRNDIVLGIYDFENYKDNAFEVFVKAGKKFGDGGAKSFAAYVSYAYQSSATGTGGDTRDWEDDEAEIHHNRGTLANPNFKWQAHKLAVGFDWTPRLYGPLVGVAGVYGGLARVSTEYSGSVTSEQWDTAIKDWAPVGTTPYDIKDDKFKAFYGIRAGVQYELSDNAALELVGKFEMIDPDLSNIGATLAYIHTF